MVKQLNFIRRRWTAHTFGRSKVYSQSRSAWTPKACRCGKLEADYVVAGKKATAQQSFDTHQMQGGFPQRVYRYRHVLLYCVGYCAAYNRRDELHITDEPSWNFGRHKRGLVGEKEADSAPNRCIHPRSMSGKQLQMAGQAGRSARRAPRPFAGSECKRMQSIAESPLGCATSCVRVTEDVTVALAGCIICQRSLDEWPTSVAYDLLHSKSCTVEPVAYWGCQRTCCATRRSFLA